MNIVKWLEKKMMDFLCWVDESAEWVRGDFYEYSLRELLNMRESAKQSIKDDIDCEISSRIMFIFFLMSLTGLFLLVSLLVAFLFIIA